MTYQRPPVKKSTHRVLIWLAVAGVTYLIAGIGLYFLQDTFLFHPTVLAKNYIFRFPLPFVEVNIPLHNSGNFNYIKFFPAHGEKKGVVLYFHGNSENVTRYAKFAANFTRNGYEVWMPDYPGFGKSTGELSENILYQQAAILYAEAGKLYAGKEIIIYGKSLGTGIASQLASVYNCRLLMLETPYYSIPDLFSTYAPVYPTSLISNYQLPVYKYLKDVHVPVFIFHGTADKVIPYRCAAKLKSTLKATDEFITIEGGRHNNLNDFQVLHTKINTLLNN